MIITTLAVHRDGAAAALELLRWITELGGVQHRTLVLATTPTTDPVPLIVEAQKSWGRVEQFVVPLRQDTLPWPVGNNLMFYAVCQFMQRFNEPFFWLEPDVFPTRRSWLDELEVEYSMSGKLFLGALMTLLYYGREVPESLHMNGAGVYPPNVLKYLPTALYLTTALVGEPFDVRLRWEMLHLVDGNGGFKAGPDNGRISICHASALICLCYKSYDYQQHADGSMSCRVEPACNFRPLKLEQHALHHGCKDGSLLTLLRARLRAERGQAPLAVVQAAPLTLVEPPGSTAPPRTPDPALAAPQNPYGGNSAALPSYAPPTRSSAPPAPRVIAKKRRSRKTKKTRRRKPAATAPAEPSAV